MRLSFIVLLLGAVPVLCQTADPGRPVLKRGGPATEHKTGEAPSQQPADSERAPYKVIEVDAEGRAESVLRTQPQSPEEDLLDRARAVAYEFTTTLPDFICDQSVVRYQGEGLRPKWKMKDRLEAELVYFDGKEEYQNIRRNGRRLRKGSPEESGQWSTGEFGTTLADLMSDATHAKFTPIDKPSDAAGITAKLYRYTVAEIGAHWQIRIGRPVFPAYQGKIWVDPESARVLRIEMDTYQLPKNYEVDKVEMVIDYDWVEIAGKKHLLPVKSENLSCKSGTVTCYKNEIQFRNYRKFGVDSQVLQTDSEISFPTDDGKPAKKPDYIPPSLDPNAKPIPPRKP